MIAPCLELNYFYGFWIPACAGMKERKRTLISEGSITWSIDDEIRKLTVYFLPAGRIAMLKEFRPGIFI